MVSCLGKINPTASVFRFSFMTSDSRHLQGEMVFFFLFFLLRMLIKHQLVFVRGGGSDCFGGNTLVSPIWPKQILLLQYPHFPAWPLLMTSFYRHVQGEIGVFFVLSMLIKHRLFCIRGGGRDCLGKISINYFWSGEEIGIVLGRNALSIVWSKQILQIPYPPFSYMTYVNVLKF